MIARYGFCVTSESFSEFRGYVGTSFTLNCFGTCAVVTNEAQWPHFLRSGVDSPSLCASLCIHA